MRGFCFLVRMEENASFAVMNGWNCPEYIFNVRSNMDISCHYSLIGQRLVPKGFRLISVTGMISFSLVMFATTRLRLRRHLQ